MSSKLVEEWLNAYKKGNLKYAELTQKLASLGYSDKEAKKLIEDADKEIFSKFKENGNGR
ncbi:MAG TPA: hypothetical protein VJ583_03525 [Nitrososphaeraceae archaeon]|nr:hypothetical protein [Nitrososphaeraceae archaeon]